MSKRTKNVKGKHFYGWRKHGLGTARCNRGDTGKWGKYLRARPTGPQWR